MRKFFIWSIVILVFAGAIFWMIFFGKSLFVINQKLTSKSICNSSPESESQICKFLNFKSPFSTNEVNKQILNREDQIFAKLGRISTSKAEGILLGYTKNTDNIILAVGFDTSNDERLAVPIRLPLSVFEDLTNPVGFIINKVSSKNLTKTAGFDILKKEDEIFSKLDSMIGQVMVVMFTNESLTREDLDLLNKTKLGRQLSDDLEKQLTISQTLLSRLNTNGLGEVYRDKNHDLVQIYTINDLNKVDITKIPIISAVIVNLNSNEK